MKVADLVVKAQTGEGKAVAERAMGSMVARPVVVEEEVAMAVDLAGEASEAVEATA